MVICALEGKKERTRAAVTVVTEMIARKLVKIDSETFFLLRYKLGGPLMGEDKTNPMNPYSYLAGIVSFGPSDCGTPGYPGVYTVNIFLNVFDELRLKNIFGIICRGSINISIGF